MADTVTDQPDTTVNPTLTIRLTNGDEITIHTLPARDALHLIGLWRSSVQRTITVTLDYGDGDHEQMWVACAHIATMALTP